MEIPLDKRCNVSGQCGQDLFSPCYASVLYLSQGDGQNVGEILSLKVKGMEQSLWPCFTTWCEECRKPCLITWKEGEFPTCSAGVLHQVAAWDSLQKFDLL